MRLLAESSAPLHLAWFESGDTLIAVQGLSHKDAIKRISLQHPTGKNRWRTPGMPENHFPDFLFCYPWCFSNLLIYNQPLRKTSVPRDPKCRSGSPQTYITMRVARPVKPLPQPRCQYCGAHAVLVSSGSPSYPYREDHGTLWLCGPCQAWIGIYSRSSRNVPLGQLANAELREWKAQLHAALEPMAVTKARRDAISIFEARAKGYRWLANALQIDEKACTIHQLDPDQCRAAVGVIEQFGRSRLDHAPSE